MTNRFWSKVAKTEYCWEWTAYRDRGGYGEFGIGSRIASAHRVAFELAFGPIPDGLHVLHVCDNRACCRNDDEGWYEVNGILHPRRGHLWLGTNLDNAIDRENKGRRVSVCGEDHGNAVLSNAAVQKIRARYIPHVVTQKALAEEFGCSEGAIWGVLHGRRYGSVAMAE
jgi:hypothetical protein